MCHFCETHFFFLSRIGLYFSWQFTFAHNHILTVTLLNETFVLECENTESQHALQIILFTSMKWKAYISIIISVHFSVIIKLIYACISQNCTQQNWSISFTVSMFKNIQCRNHGRMLLRIICIFINEVWSLASTRNDRWVGGIFNI